MMHISFFNKDECPWCFFYLTSAMKVILNGFKKRITILNRYFFFIKGKILTVKSRRKRVAIFIRFFSVKGKSLTIKKRRCLQNAVLINDKNIIDDVRFYSIDKSLKSRRIYGCP